MIFTFDSQENIISFSSQVSQVLMLAREERTPSLTLQLGQVIKSQVPFTHTKKH